MGWLTDKGQELLVALKAADIQALVDAEHVDDPAPRHVLAIQIDLGLLHVMVQQDAETWAFKCIDGVPRGANLASSFVEIEPSGEQRLYLIFEHESFPMVEAGAKPSEKFPVFGRVLPNDFASNL